MDTGELLLRAVLTDPACDTARLVYADWLEEQGKDRHAEFIRRFGTGDNWPLVHDLRNDLLALVPGATVSGFGLQADADGGRPYWRFGLPGRAGASVLFVFERGFVSHIELPCAAFLAHAEAIFRAHPCVGVRLTDCPVFPSSGNNTYYLGGLGRLPQRYWSHLDSLPSESAVLKMASWCCVDHGRRLAGLPPPPLPPA